MFDIIGIDSSCVDHIVTLDRMPHKDEEIEINKQSWQGGGKVATALTAASRLGAKTALMGILGDDAFGRFLVRDLARDGVDVSHLLMETGAASDYCISLAERETSTRTFLVEWGTHRQYQPSDLDQEIFQHARCLHLYQMNETGLAAAKLAKSYGMKVCFDADAYDPSVMENIGLIDYFIGSEFFYQSLFQDLDPKEGCSSLLKDGPECVIFTFGKNGCTGAWAEGVFQHPAWSIPAIDTTGAGDTFHGAFLQALLCQNMTVSDAANFASAVSAIKCMFLGGRAGLPTLNMVQEFMRCQQFEDQPLRLREAMYSSLPV